MIEFYDFGISLEQYHSLGKGNSFPEVYCCSCGYEGRLRKHGFYERNALSSGGSFRIPIQRYLCPSCGRTVSLLPSFLHPRFQYVLSFVVSAVMLVKAVGLSSKKAWSVLTPSWGSSFSQQNVSFYVRRAESNEKMYALYLSSVGAPVKEGVYSCLLAEVFCFGAEALSLSFKKRWDRFLLQKV